MNSKGYLFNRVEWSAVEQGQNADIKKEILQMGDDRILNTPIEDLCDYYEKKYEIIAPRLIEDNIVVDSSEVNIDVSHDRSRYIRDKSKPFYLKGTEIEITLPFDGDGEMFHISPNIFSTNLPIGTIQNQEIIFSISGLDLTSESVQTAVSNTISNIKEKLTRLQSLASQWNPTIRVQSKQQIELRKKKILSDRNLIESLGFPLKVRTGGPETYKAPNVRRKIKPVLPPINKKPFKPEPEISNEDYNHILNVIENMAQVMERSPTAFINMDEESLRTHFLVQLNGHYEGQATGETFNFEGKTDILIRTDGKNIFIGECKFWSGQKKLISTIDQILSYSSWRDTKVAILIFNRKKDFSRILELIPKIVGEHNNFKRNEGQISETQFRFIFSHANDINREIVLSILAFDVPK